MSHPIHSKIQANPALGIPLDVPLAESVEPVEPVEQLERHAGEPAARVASLSRILRGIGAAALIAAASSFLLQHWETGGDLERYYALLAHTGLLAAVGFVCGLRVGDGKGARTFLAIAAGLVPAQFCILGGLLYSQLSWDGPLTPVAGYATWVAPSATAALATAAATLAVTAPVVLLAFLALARCRARLLTAAYVAANLTLLVPTRDPSVVAGLAGALLALHAVIEVRWLRGETALRTLEGALVRTMLFAPIALLLARSVLHYELSAFYYAVLCAAAALGITALAVVERIPRRFRELLHSASLVPTAGACACVTVALMDGPGLAERFAIPVGSLLYASAVVVLSLLAGGAAWGARFRRSAALVAVGGTVVNLVLFPGAFASIACLVAAIATLSYGFLMERKALFVAGLGGVVFAGAQHLEQALSIYAFSHWGSLALLGVIVILGASLLERHWELLVEHASALRRRFAGWE